MMIKETGDLKKVRGLKIVGNKPLGDYPEGKKEVDKGDAHGCKFCFFKPIGEGVQAGIDLFDGVYPDSVYVSGKEISLGIKKKTRVYLRRDLISGNDENEIYATSLCKHTFNLDDGRWVAGDFVTGFVGFCPMCGRSLINVINKGGVNSNE